MTVSVVVTVTLAALQAVGVPSGVEVLVLELGFVVPALAVAVVVLEIVSAETEHA